MRSTTESKYLLLDSCIVEYWLDKYLNPAVYEFLSKKSELGTVLAVSEISYMELIDGAYKEKIERVRKLLEKYIRFEVSQRVLSGAALLSSIYSLQNAKTNGASMEDKIIAMTSLVHRAQIVTANVADFPYPFFVQVESENILFRKKNKDQYLSIAVLKPNVEIINSWYEKLP